MEALKTVEDMAALFGKSVSWAEKQSHRWPRLRVGRSPRFTPEHVAEIFAMYEYRPVGVPTRDEVARRREQRGRRLA